jgi:beta-hydroxylase
VLVVGRIQATYQHTCEKCGLEQKPDQLTPYTYPGAVCGTWSNIRFVEGGVVDAELARLLPVTVEALHVVPRYPQFREALISVLQPGARIKPHRDADKNYLTCQMGLLIPKNCHITVGGETRVWREGECMIFDTSYEHEVWQDGDFARVVLLFDFLHPELTEVERDFYSTAY